MLPAPKFPKPDTWPAPVVTTGHVVSAERILPPMLMPMGIRAEAAG